MCFDGKKQLFEKNVRESTVIVITKKCRKNKKFWTHDEVKLIHWLSISFRLSIFSLLL